MEYSPDMQETAWKRAQVDFRRCLGTIWFWCLDAGGGALMAWAASPVWGVIWVLLTALVTYAFVLARAPIAQRNEARDILAKVPRKDSLTVRDAAKLLRDSLEDDTVPAAVIDFYPEDGEDPLREAIVFLKKGLQQGVIKATGIPKNGLSRRDIPRPLHYDSERSDAPEEFVGGDGRVFVDVEIQKRSIADLAKHLNETSVRVEAESPEWKG